MKRPVRRALLIPGSPKFIPRRGRILDEIPKMMRSLLAMALLLPVGAAAPAQEKATGDAEGIEFFEKKIRPVLAERCYECHSENAKKLKGSLRLDSKAAMLKGGDTGPSIVPGDPQKSLLVKAIRQKDEELKMPPKGKLTDVQIADFEAWI